MIFNAIAMLLRNNMYRDQVCVGVYRTVATCKLIHNDVGVSLRGGSWHKKKVHDLSGFIRQTLSACFLPESKATVTNQI